MQIFASHISSLKSFSKTTLVVFLSFTTCLGQCYASNAQPPIVSAVDANGVDVISGTFLGDAPPISIGNATSGMQFRYLPNSDNYQNRIVYYYTPISNNLQALFASVSFDGKTNIIFLGTKSDFAYSAQLNTSPYNAAWGGGFLSCTSQPDAAFATDSLTDPFHTGYCTLYTTDGERVDFNCNHTPGYDAFHASTACIFEKLTRSDGEIIKLEMPFGFYSSSLGWRVHFGGGLNYYKRYTSNASVTYCTVENDYCSTGNNYPEETYYFSPHQPGETYSTGPSLHYRNNQLQYTNYYAPFRSDGNPTPEGLLYKATKVKPSGYTKEITVGVVTYVSSINMNMIDYSDPDRRIGYAFTLGTLQKVFKVKNGGKEWNYSYERTDPSTNEWTAIITAPDNSKRTIVSHYEAQLSSISDEIGHVTSYEHPGYVDPTTTKVTRPNGGYTTYAYSHGAVVEAVDHSSDGTLTTTGVYASVCDTTNYRVCNKPTSVTDANGNVTNYTYDPAHGGVLTETGPADVNGVRPQKRYSYTQLYAKVLNASGQLVNAEAPVWRLTKVSYCLTATSADPASCTVAGQRDKEHVTIMEYNSNNLFLTRVIEMRGDANINAAYSATNQWQATSYTYDDIGNTTSVDGPLAGDVDKVYTTYDVLRRPIFEIGADPDGTGSLKRVIVKHFYDADGNENRTEMGNGTAVDGSDFVPSSFKRMTYDSVTGLLVKTEVGQP